MLLYHIYASSVQQNVKFSALSMPKCCLCCNPLPATGHLVYRKSHEGNCQSCIPSFQCVTLQVLKIAFQKQLNFKWLFFFCPSMILKKCLADITIFFLDPLMFQSRICENYTDIKTFKILHKYLEIGLCHFTSSWSLSHSQIGVVLCCTSDFGVMANS